MADMVSSLTSHAVRYNKLAAEEKSLLLKLTEISEKKDACLSDLVKIAHLPNMVDDWFGKEICLNMRYGETFTTMRATSRIEILNQVSTVVDMLSHRTGPKTTIASVYFENPSEPLVVGSQHNIVVEMKQDGVSEVDKVIVANVTINVTS